MPAKRGLELEKFSYAERQGTSELGSPKARGRDRPHELHDAGEAGQRVRVEPAEAVVRGAELHDEDGPALRR